MPRAADLEYWEECEERERRIAALKALGRRAAAPLKPQEPKQLVAAMEVQAFASLEDVRRLAEARYDAPVVSLYLSLSPDEVRGDPKAYATVFKSLKKKALERNAPWLQTLDRKHRQALDKDLAEIEVFLSTSFSPDGCRSLVLFKSGESLNRLIKLGTRTHNALDIGFDAYTLPLEAILEEYEKALVACVTKERTEFLTYHLGFEEPLPGLRSFVPSETRSLPSKIQRHRLTHLYWHLKDTAALLRRYRHEYRCQQVILFGDQRVLDLLEPFLDDLTRRSVIARFPELTHATRAEMRKLIEQAMHEARRQLETRALERLPDYRAQGLLAEGLEAVLAAANTFLVKEFYIDMNLHRAGFACRTHHYLSVQLEECPFCSQKLLPVDNIVDELIELARVHRTNLLLVQHRSDLLAPSQGIAAVRYNLQRDLEVEDLA